MSANYQPDAIELETPCFMPYAHGCHREKDGVGLTAEDDFLLSLCFCPPCLTLAAKGGVDGAAARRATRRLVAEALERELPKPRWPDFRQRGLDVVGDHSEILDYARWRAEPVTSLVAEIRDRAHPASKVYVIDILDGWLGGCDATALGRACDGLIFCADDMTAAETADVIARGRVALGPNRFVRAGLRAFHPEMAGASDLAAKTGAAVAAGADGVNVYNFGLVPAARLDWVQQAVAAARAA